MHRWLAATSALFLFGCLSVPEPEPPDPDVALDEHESWSNDVSSDPVLSDWIPTFQDPLLVELVDESLARNRDLRSAVARVDQASARARIAGADLYPQVAANYDVTRSSNVIVGLPLGAPGAPPPSFTFTSHGISLDASWEIDLWGKLRARRSAGEADFRAAQADLDGARLSLAAQTAKGWYGLVEARMQRDLAIQTTETFRNNVEVVEDRYEAGLRSALDLRLAKSDAAAAEALLQEREQQLDFARRALESLLGRYPEGELEAQVDLPPLPPPIPAGLPSELLHRRPDLLAAEERYVASGLRVHEARTQLLPSINLVGSVGRTGNELSNLFDTDFDVWALGGSLFAPIFQGGRLKAGVQLAEAVVREFLALYQSLVLRAFFEVETALAAERFFEREEQQLRTAMLEAQEAQRIAEEQYRAGLIDVITLLSSQRRALESEGAWLGIRRVRLETRIDLHLALGGGFRAADAEAMEGEVESGEGSIEVDEAPTDGAPSEAEPTEPSGS